MRCFILAGGFATRLWPLTEERAKPLLPLAGYPILTHLILKVPVGVQIIVSTNAVFEEDFKRWKKTITTHDVTIRIEDAKHDDHKLGALGAVRAWLEEENVADDILLLAGDNYIGFALSDFIASFRGNPLLAAHDIQDKTLAARFGTVIVKKGTNDVVAFEEKPKEPQSTLVSTGCYVLPAKTIPTVIAFAKDRPDNIGGIFEEFLRLGIAVDCKTFAEIWRDIGSFQMYLDTHKELLNGKPLADPSAELHADTKLEGSVYVGPRTVLKASKLTNCLLFGNTTVENCILEDCIIDADCRLRNIDLRGKMIRKGSILTGKSR